MSLISQKEFFKKFNISNDDFVETGIKWEEMEKIYDDYILRIGSIDYESIAQAISNKLNKIPEANSTKYRLKNAEHLIEKIIRKRIENNEEIIDLKNYNERITDIIGIRILHLFKEDWDKIHKFITAEFDLVEDPIAYYRNGDSQEYVDYFKNNNCKTEEHRLGYRSVHYLVKTPLFKKQYVAEIQARTIFEEGWSEVDHKLKYPYVKNNIILERFLGILNRFAGGADEMCSFIKYLQVEIERYDQTISDLKNKVDKLEIESSKKVEIKENIDGLRGMFIDTSGLAQTMQDMQQAFRAIDISELTNTAKLASESLSSIKASGMNVFGNPNNLIGSIKLSDTPKLSNINLKDEKTGILLEDRTKKTSEG